MNVLILGGTGVISTSIVDVLHDLSHNVTVLNRGIRKARYKTAPEIITADKKDKDAFGRVMNGRRFDAVIDMISYTPEDAALTLDVLSRNGGHFVFCSTVAAYERPFRMIPIREESPLWSTEESFPYGFHKARMEAFLSSRTGDFPITIIRPSLTFGIGCKNVGVMRNNYGIVSRLRRHKPIVVFGDGTNPWAWTFAPDLAKAFAGVLSRPICYGQIYHATSGDRHIWDDLYREFGRCTGEEPRLIHVSTEMLMKAAPETFLHVLQEKMHCGIFDNSKICADVPEFVCSYNLEKIVKALYEWYETDSEAKVVDEAKDLLEDRIAERYYRCLDIMAEAN